MAKRNLHYKKKILASALALMMAFANNATYPITTYAEESDAEINEPVLTETPSEEEAIETYETEPETYNEVEQEKGEEEEIAPPEETVAPVDAGESERPEETTVQSDDEPIEEADLNEAVETEPEAEEVIEEVEEEPHMVIYYADSVAEYTAAVAELGDNADHRLLVTTGADLTAVLNEGRAVYYAGTYIVEFDSTEKRDLAYEIAVDQLGDNAVVVKDAEMGLCEEDDTVEIENAGSDEPDASDGEYTIEVNPEAISVAEEGLTIAESSGNAVKVIALIDTGVNGDIADVKVNLTEDPDDDANGHGTEMATIIKERGREKASIISIKAFNDNGSGSLANVTAAFKYAIEADVDIINISAAIRDSEDTEAFKVLIDVALAKGITIVAAAGNNGRPASEYVPGNIAGVDTIGACFPLDYSSAFAATPFSNYGEEVDYWYIAKSTSNAAAQETGVIAAGWEEEGYINTNKWFRFPTVAYSDGGATAVQDLYDIGSANNFMIQGINPPGSGNIDANRDGAYWAGDHYEGTIFIYKPTGERVYCIDPAHYADYDANYVPVGTVSDYSLTRTYTYPESGYRGSVTRHTVSLTPASVDPYTPGEVYTYNNTSSSTNLSADGYYVKSISVTTGNRAAIKAWIEGNSLKILVDPNEADMPDGIRVEIDTDKVEIGETVVSYHIHEENYTHLSAGASSQDFSLPDSLAGGSYSEEETGSSSTPTHLYLEANISMQVIRGGVTFDKDDLDRISTSHDGNGQGNAVLTGTEYSITNTRNGKVVAVIVTGADGKTASVKNNIDGALAVLDGTMLKYGDYLVKETVAPVGYHLNTDWSYYFEVREDGKIYNAESDGKTDTNGGKIDQKVIRGGIKVTKFDTEHYVNPNSEKNNTAQGNATLKGTEYEITNVSNDEVYVDGQWYATGEVVVTLTTDNDGFASTSNHLLPYGSYKIKETKAPEGYMLNSGWEVVINVTEEGTIYDSTDIGGAAYVKSKTENGSASNHDYVWDNPASGVVTSNFMTDDVIRGGVEFQKVDRERVFAHEAETNKPQGDATLEGAVISIYSASKNSVFVQGAWYKPGEVVATLVTDADGYVKTADDLLPYGDYYAIETQAPVGYLVNTNWKYEFTIGEDKEIIEGTESEIQDQVIRGDVRIYKYDIELDNSEAMDGSLHKAKLANLSDIGFDIYNVSTHPILFLNDDGQFEEVQPGEKVTRIYTYYDDAVEAYVADTVEKALSYGTYTIQELPCSESGTNQKKMSSAEENTSSNDQYLFTDGEKRYFQIGEHSYGPVTLDTNIEEVDGLVVDYGSSGTPNFKTNISSDVKALISYTTYNASGAAVNNVASFWSNNGDSTTAVSNPMSDLQEANGTVYKPTGNAELDKTMIFKNQVKRNEVKFNKKNGYDNTPLETLWILKNTTSGERHVLYAGVNGEFDSSLYDHSYNTNANDFLLPLIDAGWMIDMEHGADNKGFGEVVVDYGVWFGVGEDGTIAPVDDTLASLPYGSYVLDEVSCSTNEGMELQHVTFNVYQDNSIDPDGTDLGTILDYGITMTSELLETESESHTAKSDSGVVTFVDTVNYNGVRETYKEYVLEGVLMDKDTNEPILDADGNEITSITRLTITTNSGTITGQTFTVNTENLGGKRLVAYEYLWLADVYDAKH